MDVGRTKFGRAETNRRILAPSPRMAEPNEEIPRASRDALTRLVDKATQEYSRQREIATDQFHHASKSFDQALVTLAAGAVALSVSYLRPVGEVSPLLLAAWVTFAVALSCALLSFKLIQRPLLLEAARWSEAIKRSEKGLGQMSVGETAMASDTFSVSEREELLERHAKYWRTAVAALQVVALVTFLGGVVLLFFATHSTVLK
jgi:hypothetical protein